MTFLKFTICYPGLCFRQPDELRVDTAEGGKVIVTRVPAFGAGKLRLFSVRKAQFVIVAIIYRRLQQDEQD